MFTVLGFYVSLVFTDGAEQYMWRLGVPTVATPPLLLWSITWSIVNIVCVVQIVLAFMPVGHPWLAIHDTNIVTFVLCVIAIADRLWRHELAVAQIFVCASLMCGLFLIIWDRTSIRLDYSMQKFEETEHPPDDTHSIDGYVDVELQPMTTRLAEEEDINPYNE